MIKWQLLTLVAGRTLILLSGVLLFSKSSFATPLTTKQQYSVNVAQTVNKNFTAQQAYQQAKQLYEQGTAAARVQAMKKFEEALALYQTAGDRTSQAPILIYMGKTHSDFGEKQTAQDYYKQGLSIYQHLKDKSGQATTLNNIGKIYSELGEKQKALDYYHQALPLRRQVKDKRGEAITLNNIGAIYAFLGEQQKALDYYNQSLPLKIQVGDKASWANTINSIGKVYLDLGDEQKALDYFNQSLLLSQQGKDKTNEAIALNNIGIVHSNLGNQQKALDYFQQSLPLFAIAEDKSGTAIALNNLGKVYAKLGKQQTALDYYIQSLNLFQQLGSKPREAQNLYDIASLERDQGNLKTAQSRIETSLKIVENLRSQLLSQELRTSYFATVQDYYQLYIDLLMQLHKQQPDQGYDKQALQASERARARSLLELLSEANADIRQGVEPKLLSQERLLQQKLDVLETQQVELLSRKNTESEAQALETQIATLLEQYKQIQAQIRAISPRYAALTQPQPLTLRQIQQQVLDDNTLLLEYSLGEKRSYLWAVTNKNIVSYELPKRADIEAAVQKFRQDIISPYLKHSPSINKLSQLILAPVAQQLERKRLVVVSDGALQYVPFAALITPNSQPSSKYEPLLLKHEIITLPSASTLDILRQEQKGRKLAPKTLAVLADPVFRSNDERLQGKLSRPPLVSNLDNLALSRSVSDSGINFERLRFTRQEAEAILALVPHHKGKPALDFTASRQTATSEELSQYRIIHFATHGIFNSKHPELSGVVLSLFDDKGMPQNGFLRLRDIFNLNLQSELVVLSACQTGLGEEIKGEGLVGLTRGFMYAGSPRVVVSLWSVDDQATSELMQRFYQQMLQARLKPAAALRNAQIEIWRKQKYAAPYYWAAFTLQGEWN
ncbi:CHAT domain-containing tetratricopeptide repeat protein [Anabaena sp. UHCC 0399]|uniref:CHAT domain-containing tetratricopeptide repeat protein n=1 Tax=Anabaena sp. UHCC 0399 TaxID=3110238 RepID=UPI002B1ED025|nr:CHAT domain-containing protein [Anabaena sp. UHCC 0399]MEA5568229.1 CHAT domain-containing protein [Anabaena sp. UHCC 0399]